MEGKQEGNTKVKLFREKSLEAVESPEALNDYLQVTSPGVWMVLVSVILLLIGGIIWSIFGRIDTTVQVAVSSEASGVVCYVPYQLMDSVMASGSIRISEQSWPIQPDAEARLVTVGENMNPFVRVAGNLQIGDLAVETRIHAELPEGVYTGTVVTESIQPISLLLQKVGKDV